MKQHSQLPQETVRRTYAKNLADIRQQLPLHNKLLSYVIHAPIVEQLLGFIATYLATPTALIGGGTAGLISILIYAIAKLYGYTLAGSEVITLFGAGWLIGLFVTPIWLKKLRREQRQ